MITAKQEKAIQMITLLPDNRVDTLIEVMQGFLEPISNTRDSGKSRIGAAKGKFVVPDDIDECNEEIARMFGVSDS